MSSKKNVLAIAIMFALFFMIAFVTGIQNPLGVIVKSHFELSNFQSQWGTLANFLAYLCMGIPSGMMLQKIDTSAASSAVAFGFTGVLFFPVSEWPTNFSLPVGASFPSFDGMLNRS